MLTRGNQRHAGRDEFVGRERERSEYGAALRDVLGGRGRLLMITGEPGIGKTWLAGECAREAEASGATVLWGRSWEGGGAPAFWPWTQIVREYVRGLAPESVCDMLGPSPRDLLQLAPEIEPLIDRCPASASPLPGADDARFRVFDAVARMLEVAASRRPVMLVLDDLHAADPATLRLLHFVARDVREAQLLLLCTYREGEVRLDPQLSESIGELAREGHRLLLRGLSPTEVAALVARRLQAEPPAALVEAVFDASEGNPFFVDELLRVLVAEVGLERATAEALRHLRAPDQVREAVRRHLRPLPLPVREVLAIAAVIGREFDQAILERVVQAEGATGAGAGVVADLLREAVVTRVVVESTSPRQHYRFAHGLIRETLYDDLPPARRLALHQAIGHTLVAAHRMHPEPHLSEIAHHFVRALPGGDARVAVSALRQAGAFAMRQLAYEVGAGHYRQALDVLAASGMPDPQLRCELLLELGEALSKGTDGAAARAAFADAADLARSLGGGSALARAALGLADIGLGLPEAAVNEQTVELFRVALAGLGDADSAWRARLTSRLAVELYYGLPLEQRRELVDAAVATARRLRDPSTLAHTLGDWRSALRVPATLGERMAVAEEMFAQAQRAGDDDLLLRVHAGRIIDFLECADGVALDREIAALSRRAAALRQPRHLWIATHFRAVRAHIRGDLDEAERLASEAAAYGEETKDPSAGAVFATLLFAIRMAQGRLAEVDPAMRAHLEHYSIQPGAACGLAYLHAECGRVAEARALFERLAAADFAAVPEDNAWLMATSWLAEVCVFLGDDARAAALYRRLLPYRDRLAVVAHPATFCDAPVAYYLGRLATLRSHWDEAFEHFDESLQIAARMGMRAAAARTQHAWAAALAGRDSSGDRDGARARLAEATSIASALGLRALLREMESLYGQLSSAAAAAQAQENAAEALFRREGEFWTLRYAGLTCRVRDAKGFSYLAELLQNPGHALPAIDLVGRPGDAGPLSGFGKGSGAAASLEPQNDLGDAGSLLDVDARRAYKRRLSELAGEIEEARRANDSGEAARLGAEVEFLERELARAVGLGGRERRAGSHVERARVNVTRAISSALKRIADQHSDLGAHLTACVRTGTFCSYIPDPRSPVRWHV